MIERSEPNALTELGSKPLLDALPSDWEIRDGRRAFVDAGAFVTPGEAFERGAKWVRARVLDASNVGSDASASSPIASTGLVGDSQ